MVWPVLFSVCGELRRAVLHLAADDRQRLQRGVGDVDVGVDVGHGVGERGNVRQLRARGDGEALVDAHAGIGRRFLAGRQLRLQRRQLILEVQHRLAENGERRNLTLLIAIWIALHLSLQQAVHHALNHRHHVSVGGIGILQRDQVRHLGVDVDAGGGIEFLLQRVDHDVLALLQLRRRGRRIGLLAQELLHEAGDACP